MKQVTAKLSGSSYPILVGVNLTNDLARLLKKCVGQGRLFVFFDANFYALHGEVFKRNLDRLRIRSTDFVVPSGEKTKSARVLAGVYDFLLGEKIGRDDFILAVGGGVTADLVGYAAATTLRGIRWGVVPTTLVGMVDAGIGGKTGIDHERGKNLIGAFWQPAFVGCDVRYLMTLPERQLLSGLGEVAKTVGLAGPGETQSLVRFLDDGAICDEKALADLVFLCANFKARVILRDERDRGARMVLNYGHTFAHGIEKALGYGRLTHGEAVLIGIEAALALGEKCGYRSKALAGYRALVTDLLSRIPKRRVDPERVWQAMALDKKRSAQNHRFVILKNLGRPIVTDRIKPAAARSALAEALEHYRICGGRHA